MSPNKYPPPEQIPSAERQRRLYVEAVKEIARQGEKFVNRQLPQGLNLTRDFKGMGLEEARRRPPAVGAEYKRPIELFDGGPRGTAGVQGRYDPESGESYFGGNVRLKFAKGGKVKKYSKGGGVRKPKLK